MKMHKFKGHYHNLPPREVRGDNPCRGFDGDTVTDYTECGWIVWWNYTTTDIARVTCKNCLKKERKEELGQ